MRLRFARLGARTTGNEYHISDQVTTNVSELSVSSRVGRGIYPPTKIIRLFNANNISSFNTHMECVTFVNSVEVCRPLCWKRMT